MEETMTSAPNALEQFLPSVLRETWGVFQKNALTFVIAALIAAFLSGITIGLLTGPLFVGFVDLVRRARRGEAVQMGEVFGRFDSFGSSLVATILIGIAVIVGSCLLVVPGLLAALFSAFSLHVIAYQRASAIDAIKRSVQIVRDNFLITLVLFLLVSVLQTLGGSVVLGVLLTLPLGMIAVTVAYEQLASAPEPALAQAGAPQ
jgi:uncharacterized membrane protein